MEANLHLQQGLTLLHRILSFYPLMREGDHSTVTLSDQDWIVLMDFIENPEGAAVRPDAVTDMAVDRGAREITITTTDCVVKLLMGF